MPSSRTSAGSAAKWDGRLFFASDYFGQMYEWAVELIKKGMGYRLSRAQIILQSMFHFFRSR